MTAMTAMAVERRTPWVSPVSLGTGDAFGVRAVVDTLRRHRKLVGMVFAAVLVIALLYGVLATPVYRADTLVQIDSRPRSTLLAGLDDADRSSRADPERPSVAGEIEILRSREVLRPVIEATGADVEISAARRGGFLPVGARHGVKVRRFALPESRRGEAFKLIVDAPRWELFDAADRSVAKGSIGTAQRFDAGAGGGDGEEGSIEIDAPATLPPMRLTLRQLVPMKAHERVIDRMRLFEPSRESQVVRLSYEDSDPARAAALLNAQVAAYVARMVQRRTDEGNKALTFLEGQLPALKRRIETGEEALSRLQKTSAAVPLSTEAEALTRQRGDLERQRVELEIKRDQLAQTYTPAHPDMAAVLAQLKNVARASERVQGGIEQLPEAQRDVMRVQRELQINTQQYTAMLTQAQQLRIAGAGWLAHARQLDRAEAPVEPVRPRALAVTSVALGVGTLLSLLVAAIARSTRGTMSHVHEIEERLSAPTIVAVPQSMNQPLLMDGRLREAVDTDIGTHRLLARAAPQDPAVEGLRSLHLSLMQRAGSIAAQVILISSPTYGAGSAFVASNLAALMAETGKRVLLVETDLRRPGIHRYVEIDRNAPGLTDVLYGIKMLDEVIVLHASANMDALLHGATVDNPGSLLMTEGLAEIVAGFRKQYDHVVLHAAPLLHVGDALAVGRLADCALLVVRAEQSLLGESHEAVKRLERAGVRLEGVIFNGVKNNGVKNARPDPVAAA